MRYPAAEKLEIIRLVEQSHLPVRRTLARIGIPPTTFYRWYDRFVEYGPEGLEDALFPFPGLEPDPRSGAGSDRGLGFGRDRTVAVRIGSAVH